MSYCVNCGVELASSEKSCPLCGTEVINPREPWREPRMRPYPHTLERIVSRIDRRYLAAIIGLGLLIPVLVTLICNILVSGAVTWAAYVVGACAVVFVMVTLPLYFTKYPLWLNVAADGAAIILFLLFIEQVGQDRWFLKLGLPISAGATVFTLLVVLISEKNSKLRGVAAALLFVGLYTVLIDFFISLYETGNCAVGWSLYALAPCVVLAAIVRVVDGKKKLKEEIRRRLYF